MPLVKIEIYEGKSLEYKAAILDGVHRALVTAFKILEDDRNQRLYELIPAHFERRTAKYSDNFTIIEITAFKGRSLNAKKSLYREIVKNLAEKPCIKPSDVLIVINEPPLENWGVSGGRPASEVDLGFDINV
jgi:phenylpyruvate tautomerase PptA (4-oxalocrotonate tautomerase family)